MRGLGKRHSAAAPSARISHRRGAVGQDFLHRRQDEELRFLHPAALALEPFPHAFEIAGAAALRDLHGAHRVRRAAAGAIDAQAAPEAEEITGRRNLLERH